MKRLLLFCVVMILSVPDLAFAKLIFEPGLTLREEYTDNLFLDPHDEEEDFVTTVRPALRLGITTNYLNLELDYGLNFKFYEDHSEKDETSLRDTQRISLLADILPERDFTVAIRDDLTRVTIDERDQVSEESEFVNKTNRNRFVVNPGYTYRVKPTFKASLDYQYERIDYDSSEGDDSEAHDFSFDLDKELSSRLSLNGGYGYGEHQATISEDFRRHDFSGGFSWRAGPRVTLAGSAGASKIDYKIRDDFWSRTGTVLADYHVSERLELGLSYEEDFSSSVKDGGLKGKALDLTVGYRDRIEIDFDLFAAEDEYKTIERRDRSVGASLSTTYPLSSRVSVGGSGEFSNHKFEPDDEDVRRWSVGGFAEYLFRIFKVVLGYRLRVNDSEFNENDYRNNIVYLEASLDLE